MQNTNLVHFSAPKYIERNTNGLIGPVLNFSLEADSDVSINHDILDIFIQRFSCYEHEELESGLLDKGSGVSKLLLNWIYSICRDANWPIFQTGLIKQLSTSSLLGNYIIPTQRQSKFLPYKFTKFLVANLTNNYEPTNTDKLSKAMATYIKLFRHAGLRGSNQRWVQLELHRRGKNVNEITSGIVQVGSGKDARIVRGTTTEQARELLVEIQKDKVATARLLRLHGIPTVTHERVFTLQQALRAADKLGYPVVLKPYNGTQDRHVHVNITTPHELEHACTRTQFPIEDGLIETFIEGQIYRILMVKNSIIYCSYKKHEYITGDGYQTIRHLIEEHCNTAYKTINALKAKMDYNFIIEKNRIIERLDAQGDNLNTVLPKGARFRITRIPGMSSGSVVHYTDITTLPDTFTRNVTYISRLFGGAPLGIDAIGKNLSHVKFNEVNFGPQLSHTTGSYYVDYMNAEFP